MLKTPKIVNLAPTTMASKTIVLIVLVLYRGAGRLVLVKSARLVATVLPQKKAVLTSLVGIAQVARYAGAEPHSARGVITESTTTVLPMIVTLV